MMGLAEAAFRNLSEDAAVKKPAMEDGRDESD